jgi:hypothetical protein
MKIPPADKDVCEHLQVSLDVHQGLYYYNDSTISLMSKQILRKNKKSWKGDLSDADPECKR